MRHTLTILATFSMLMGLVGCQEMPTRATEPGEPIFEIRDAHHSNGNPHFFFLPPLVREPSFNGSFDAGLSPEVRICEWAADECTVHLITFTMDSGEGSERIRMASDPGDEHFVVQWHTNRFALDPAKTYRLIVSASGHELGHADIDVVSNGDQLTHGDTGAYVGLVNGRTLPIKFRIEVGAIPDEPSIPASPIAMNWTHGCALLRSGAAVCWGANGYGQLGDGTLIDSETPVAVVSGSFIQIATGRLHTCALDTNGAAFCWGYDRGQLGQGSTPLRAEAPVAVTGGHRFTHLTSGEHHSCGLKADGSAWCWGDNRYGQLGDGNLGSYFASTPVQALGGPYQQIDAGNVSTCGVTTSGIGKCWGSNLDGRAGTGPANLFTPVELAGGFEFLTD